MKFESLFRNRGAQWGVTLVTGSLAAAMIVASFAPMNMLAAPQAPAPQTPGRYASPPEARRRAAKSRQRPPGECRQPSCRRR